MTGIRGVRGATTAEDNSREAILQATRQLLDNHYGALERLLEFIDTPKTAGDCFAPLFKRSIGKGEYGLALVEAFAHLSHLHQSGKATRTRNADGAWLFQRVR